MGFKSLKCDDCYDRCKKVVANILATLNKRLCRLLFEICNVVSQNYKVSLRLFHPTSLRVAKRVKTENKILWT